MKTFTFFLVMFFLLSNVTIFGQIKPITNLFYQQTYDYGDSYCPAFNCFSLSWQQPDSTRDTIDGYKIYRNDIFYTFVKEPGIGCSGLLPCNYNDWYSVVPFWVIVKAIYNRDSLASVAIDSVEVTGIAINVQEKDKLNFSLLKNPIEAGENISLLNPNPSSEKLIIKVVSLKGEILKQSEINYSTKSVIYLPSTSLEKGLYFLEIGTNEQKMTIKLLIQ